MVYKIHVIYKGEIIGSFKMNYPPLIDDFINISDKSYRVDYREFHIEKNSVWLYCK